MIVLDRPNPCDYIDGPILQPAFKSFVGMLPIPVLHGCTVGELANQKEMIVLDRPNPCDYIDGPILQPAFKSFVGMLPIPVLHGCTVGELAQMINGEGWLGRSTVRYCNRHLKVL